MELKTPEQVASHFSVYCSGLQRKKFEALMTEAINGVVQQQAQEPVLSGKEMDDVIGAIQSIIVQLNRMTTGNLAHAKGNMLSVLYYLEQMLIEKKDKPCIESHS